jgi:hypothetical protein
MIDMVPRQHASYLLPQWGPNSFCREAEMIDLKKKCWREKVTAEITLSHVLHFANEAGMTMDAAEVATFLNEQGRAQAVWTHMMQAGEAYIKSGLSANPGRIHNPTPPAARAGTIHQQRSA